MRILSVTAQKPDSTGSGVYLSELVNEFNKLGHQQAVIGGVYESDVIDFPGNVTFYPVYFRTQELPYAITGMSDEMPYDSTKYSDMSEAMTEQFRTVFDQKVCDVVDEFRPDVILCHHLYFLTSLIREKYPEIKVCGICHGSDLRQVKKNPWQREYIKEHICKLNKIFVLHKEQKHQICEFYHCSEDLVEIVGTGYDSSVFHVDAEEQAKKDSNRIRYIFAGKISEKKGVISLIRALGYLQNPDNVKVVLAGGYGNKEEYAKIKQLADAAPCKVEFLGKLNHHELAKEMNKSDIFVLPSFFEGLPLVNIEAMACGLNVVCTDLPGIQEWMEDNIPDNGVVFVAPPKMENEDEAVAEELPEFEKRLAKAMEEATKKTLVSTEQVKKISWGGLAERFIDKIYK